MPLVIVLLVSSVLVGFSIPKTSVPEPLECNTAPSEIQTNSLLQVPEEPMFSIEIAGHKEGSWKNIIVLGSSGERLVFSTEIRRDTNWSIPEGLCLEYVKENAPEIEQLTDDLSSEDGYVVENAERGLVCHGFFLALMTEKLISEYRESRGKRR